MQKADKCPLWGGEMISGICRECGYLLTERAELDLNTGMMDTDPESYPVQPYSEKEENPGNKSGQKLSAAERMMLPQENDGNTKQKPPLILTRHEKKLIIFRTLSDLSFALLFPVIVIVLFLIVYLLMS